MARTRLKIIIDDLISELQNREKVGKTDSESLETLVLEIKKILEASDNSQTSRIKRALVESLDRGVNHFEETHPQLTSSMEKLIDTLNRMGI